MIGNLVVALSLLVGLGSSQQPIQIFKPPTLEEMKNAEDFQKADYVKRWSDHADYVPKSEYRWLVVDDRFEEKLNLTEKEDFCEKTHNGYVACDPCIRHCELQVAVYDNCGFMTARTCIPMNYDEYKLEQSCQEEASAEGDGKCAKLVDETITSEYNRTCQAKLCRSIQPDECSEEFPPLTNEQCVKDLKLDGCKDALNRVTAVVTGEKCSVNCPVYECQKRGDPTKQCFRIPIEKTHLYVCQQSGIDEKCESQVCREKFTGKITEEFLTDTGLVIRDGLVTCKEKCHFPHVEEVVDGYCAKKITCKKGCAVIQEQCPKSHHPKCYTAKGVSRDECNCLILECDKPANDTHCHSPITACPKGKKLATSKFAKDCCPEDTKDICVCENGGHGELCCVGDGCDDESDCKTEEECCPKDTGTGCFLHGPTCAIGVPVHKQVLAENCTEPHCQTPHYDHVGKPICCVGDACNKTSCVNENDCCEEDECCKIADVHTNDWKLVGHRCPPKCRKPYDNTRIQRHTDSQNLRGLCKGTSRCYTVDMDGKMDHCPADKCCCSIGTRLVVHECNITQIPVIDPKPDVVKCRDLKDPYSKGTCCRGKECCVESQDPKAECACPDDKSCCLEMENGKKKLHVVGTHCCKGDGCCAHNSNDCCHDRLSCCSTGCYDHCVVQLVNGSEGFVDHKSKTPEGAEPCDCRSDSTKEECDSLSETTPKCYSVDTRATECTPTCSRKLCKEHTCPNTLAAFMRRYLF